LNPLIKSLVASTLRRESSSLENSRDTTSRKTRSIIGVIRTSPLVSLRLTVKMMVNLVTAAIRYKHVTLLSPEQSRACLEIRARCTDAVLCRARCPNCRTRSTMRRFSSGRSHPVRVRSTLALNGQITRVPCISRCRRAASRTRGHLKLRTRGAVRRKPE
jgi:hypothetical protein